MKKVLLYISSNLEKFIFPIIIVCMLMWQLSINSKFPEYRPPVTNYRTVVINTAYQPSLSRAVLVIVPVKITATANLTGGQDGIYTISVCQTIGGTYTPISSLECANSVSLAIALTAVNVNGGALVASVPPQWYYKITFTTPTGSPTGSITGQAQEQLN